MMVANRDQHALVVCSCPSALGRDLLDSLRGVSRLTVLAPDVAVVEEMAATIKASPLASVADVNVVVAPFDDMALDLRRFEESLAVAPPQSIRSLNSLLQRRSEQKVASPLVAAESIDLVVAPLALRSVVPSRRKAAVSEVFRVLRKGGTVILSEIVSDEPLSPRLLDDPESPASFQELELLEAMEAAGFHGIRITHFDDAPCHSIEGIEMRKMTIEARKGKQGPCVERYQGVIYKGPWKIVEDDDGHVLKRGQRFAVCDKTFNIYRSEPYTGEFTYLKPAVEVPMEDARPWDVRHPAERLPAETKGEHSAARTTDVASPGQSGFIARVEWRGKDGALERRARLSDRYRGVFDTAEEALVTARLAFPNASRFSAEHVTADDVLRHRQETGKPLICPISAEGREVCGSAA